MTSINPSMGNQIAYPQRESKTKKVVTGMVVSGLGGAFFSLGLDTINNFSKIKAKEPVLGAMGKNALKVGAVCALISPIFDLLLSVFSGRK